MRDTSKDSNCTISVVPTFAPSMAASAGTRSTRPAAANEDTMRPVAVLLCNTAVVASPAKNAFGRLLRATPRIRRNPAPKARWMPVCTIRTPHNNSAIAPARSISVIVVAME